MWANPAWATLLGWSEDELSAESLDRLVHPDDLRRVGARGRAGVRQRQGRDGAQDGRGGAARRRGALPRRDELDARVVSADAIGLDSGHAERIFGMFQRLHSRDEYPGTGMGLAIARKVVARHGGGIWAEPRPGGGSRFCFTLPAERR